MELSHQDRLIESSLDLDFVMAHLVRGLKFCPRQKDVIHDQKNNLLHEWPLNDPKAVKLQNFQNRIIFKKTKFSRIFNLYLFYLPIGIFEDRHSIPRTTKHIVRLL